MSTREEHHQNIERARRERLFRPDTSYETALALKRSLIKYEYPDDLQSWEWIRRFPGYVAQYTTQSLYFVAPFDTALFETLLTHANKRKYTYSIYQKGTRLGGTTHYRPRDVQTPPCTQSLCHVYIDGGPIRDYIPIPL